jgi:hypothetical protein
MFSFFKKRVRCTPKARGLYAFTKYKRGDFILFIKPVDEGTLEFMRLPSQEQVFLTEEDFKSGVISNLLEFVESIPQEVFEVCSANIKIV